MRIFDCLLFRGDGPEPDLLECRLMQMQDWPDCRHVIVEAAADHQGHPKPLVFAENRERYAPWADRITYVVAGELPGMTGADPFEREAVQRDATGRGLADADPDDWLVLADLDEIPGAEALRLVQDRQTGILEMTCCLFAVDWVWGPLRASVLCAAGSVTSCSATRRAGWEWRQFGGGGHHLSWLGGQAGVAVKTAAHCHTECNDDILAANSSDSLHRQGVNPFGRVRSGFTGPAALAPVDIDATWPRYVWERRCPANWFRPREDPAGHAGAPG